jgi:hypothetical protein
MSENRVLGRIYGPKREKVAGGWRGLNNEELHNLIRFSKHNSGSTVAHACRKRRLKWVLGAWEYNWATQSPGDINMETWSSRLGVERGADDPTPENVNS